MPSIVTHTYFGMDVYKKLKPKIRKKISEKTYLSFTKGPDVFYHSYLSINSKNTRKFAYTLHDVKTKEFLISYVDHILKYRLEKNKEIVGSLYGMITHYYLDQYTHPLIYYKAGLNKVKHIEMERLIDLYMLEKREKRAPHKIKLHPLLFPSIKFSPALRNLLNRVYQDVYGLDKMGDRYISSLRKMKLNYRLFYYDRYKIKLKLYNNIALLVKGDKKAIKYLPYSNDLRKKVSYINFEHELWNNPCDKMIISNDSFFDLYNNALVETVKVINKCNEILNGDAELKSLKKIIKNNSCITGLDCDSNLKMRYFQN